MIMQNKISNGVNNKIQFCFNFLIFALAVILAFTFFSKVNAKSADIVFPVQELGNCKNQKDCRTYCDKPQNIEVCVSFAEEHNLISNEEAKKAKAFINSGKKGPGGCNSKDACEEYCDDSSNIEECVDFAEKNNLMSQDELEEAKKVKEALKKGAKLPGGCKTKKECEKYCSDDKNFEECVSFAEKAGFILKEEAEMAKKTGGKGPGGCKGKEQCEEFCSDPANEEICFDFGKEHGLIPQEDLEMMEEGKQEIKEALEDAPDDVLDCLNSSLGPSNVQKMREGKMTPKRDTGEKIRECFEESMRKEMMDEEDFDGDEDDFNDGDDFRNGDYEDNYENERKNIMERKGNMPIPLNSPMPLNDFLMPVLGLLLGVI